MVGAARRAVFFSNLGNLFLGVFIAAIAALFIYIAIYPYFKAWFTGGETWTAKDFASRDVPDQDIYFLSTTAGIAGDSGFYEETTYLFIPVGKTYYGILLLDDNTTVLTKSGNPLPEVENKYTVTGTLKDFDTIGNEIRQKIGVEIPSLRSSIYTKVLDMTDAENKGFWIAGAIACVGAALFGLYLVLRSLGRTLNGNSHPVWKNLARYKQPSQDVLRSIEAERGNGVPTQKYGELEMTRNWLLLRRTGVLQVERLQDIVWLHGHIQQGRYGNSTYFVKVYDRYGVEMRGKVKKNDFTPTLEAIHQRAPWALAGSNKDAEKTWKKDRAEFVRQVDARKQALQSGTPSTS